MLKQQPEVVMVAGGLLLLIIVGLLARFSVNPAEIGAYPTAIHTKSGGLTLIVNTLIDTNSVEQDKGVCSQPCSLRSAVRAADLLETATTITFAPGLSGTIKLGSEINVVANMTIVGPDLDPKSGQPIITISGENQFGEPDHQIFIMGDWVTFTLKNLKLGNGLGRLSRSTGVINVAKSSTLIIDHCIIENSINPNSSGGAIYNLQGNLLITDSAFRSNTSGNDETERRYSLGDPRYDLGYGGAIFNDHGTVTIAHSRFVGNTAYGNGGAIYNLFGTLNVTDSIFTRNKASYVSTRFPYLITSFQSSVDGGAIYNDHGVATILRSTFQDDSTFDGGGAIYNHSGKVDIANSIFSSNSASAGGGIYNLDGTTQIVNSTFLANNASGIFGGGAVFNSAGTVSVANTILANSRPSRENYGNYDVPNCGGVVYNDGHNLQFPGQNCGLFFTQANPKIDLVISGIRDTDDVFYTISPDSPLIDAGDPTLCASALVALVDRRGTPRNGDAKCDIGALQHSLQTATPTPGSGG